MIEEIKSHIAEVESFQSDDLTAVEEFRVKYLGKKGILNKFFASFKEVPNDKKKEFGQMVNTLKNKTQEKIDALKDAIEAQKEEKGIYGDLFRPGQAVDIGARHPINIVKNTIVEVFSNIGFNVSDGPEIEEDRKSTR